MILQELSSLGGGPRPRIALVETCFSYHKAIWIAATDYYVHPLGGGYIIFAFFAVRCPLSGVRCPASRMVSAHLKEKY